MTTARQNCRSCGVRRLFAAALALFAAAPWTARAVEPTAPSGDFIEYGVISGGGVMLDGAAHSIQSAVGQTAIGASQNVPGADLSHGWPAPERVVLNITDPVPASSFIYGTAQDFEVKATGGGGGYTFAWEWDPDGFGSGAASQPVTGPAHPNSPTTVVTITNPSANVSLLSMTDVTQTASGFYRCTVSDGSPDPDATSGVSELQKRSVLGVNVTPPSAALQNYIDGITLTAAPTGGFEPLAYQWAFRKTSSDPWTDLVDGATAYSRLGRDPNEAPGDYLVDVSVTIAGAQGPVLTIDHPLFGEHGGEYRCTVTDSQYPAQQPNSISEAQATATLTDHVAIIRHPSGGEYYAGNTEKLDVAVTGGLTPQDYVFQWRFGPNIIQNSNDNPLEFIAKAGAAPPPPYSHDAGLDDNTGYSGNYNVQVQDSSTSTAQYSLSTAIVVREAVHFPSPPQDQTWNVTESVTFTGEAAGGYPAVSGYEYAWTWNGNVLNDGAHVSGSGSTVSGAATASLTITGLGVDDEGTYEVRAKDSKWPCPEHADKCTATASAFLTVTNDIRVTDDPDGLDVYEEDDVSFSVVAGGGNPAQYVYEWYWDFGAGGVQLSDGPHPSGTGATVSGATTATLSLADVQTGPSAATQDAGAYYAIVRDGSGNAPGQSNPAVLAVYPAVRFTSNPAPVNKYETETATFTVTAGGGIRGERSYQWQEDAGSGFADLPDGGRVSGATTTTLSVSSLTLADDNKQYRCVVTSPDSDVPTLPSNRTHTSGPALLRVTAPLAILNAPADMRAYVADPAFDLRVHFEGGLPPYTADWRRAGVTPFIPEAPVGAGQILLGAPNTASLTVDPANVAPGVYAYAVELTDQVKTTRSSSGTVTIANELNFVRGLTSASVRARERFEWSIEVGGGLGNIEYQWYKDDGTKAFVPIVDDALHQGATTATLTFLEVDFADAGWYMVEVNDEFMVITTEAGLSVGTALPAAGLAGLAALAAGCALAGVLRLRRRR